MVAGVWTGVGCSKLKNCRTRIRYKIFVTGAESESEKVTPATSDIYFCIVNTIGILTDNLLVATYALSCLCIPVFDAVVV